VINPLFAGLVSFVVRNHVKDKEFSTFQSELRERLEELHLADSAEDIAWYDELEEYWLTVLEPDAIDEYIDDFLNMVHTVDPYHLMTIATKLRNDILLESLPELTYRLVSFRALYSFRWEDGLQVDYSCRPTIRSPNMVFTPELIDTLTGIFNQQLVETLLVPGLDALHDQVGKPFKQKNLDELVGVMEAYVNNKPASERDAYGQIIFRIKQQLSNEPEMKEEKEVDIEWMENGGGF